LLKRKEKLEKLPGKEFSIWGEETLAFDGLIHGEMLRVAREIWNVDSSTVG